MAKIVKNGKLLVVLKNLVQKLDIDITGTLDAIQDMLL